MSAAEKPTCALCGYPIAADPIEDVDGKHYHRVCNTVSASTLCRDSLARIAELERQLEAGRELYAGADLLRREAEAEVARLRERRCEGCRHQRSADFKNDRGHVIHMADGPWCAVGEADYDIECHDLWVCAPDDFACNRWAERGKA